MQQYPPDVDAGSGAVFCVLSRRVQQSNEWVNYNFHSIVTFNKVNDTERGRDRSIGVAAAVDASYTYGRVSSSPFLRDVT